MSTQPTHQRFLSGVSVMMVSGVLLASSLPTVAIQPTESLPDPRVEKVEMGSLTEAVPSLKLNTSIESNRGAQEPIRGCGSALLFVAESVSTCASANVYQAESITTCESEVIYPTDSIYACEGSVIIFPSGYWVTY